MNKLTKDEKKILQSYDNNEWQSVKNFSDQKHAYTAYARHTLIKDARINIRINSKDLHTIKAKAVEEGIPYQTLIVSILHKYAIGKYCNVRAA